MTSILTPISHLFENETDAKLIQSLSNELEARERTFALNLENTTHYHIDFDLNLGLSNEQKVFLNQHVKHRDNIQTLTFQMSRDCFSASMTNGQYQLASAALSRDEQLKNIEKSIKDIKDIVGSERNIGFENNNYYPTGAYEICTAADFIKDVICLNDLHLLLDFAHAKVTSVNKNLDFNFYISEMMETNQCKQIHFCEHKLINSKNTISAIDAHELPTLSTTEQVIDLAKRYNVRHLTVEYYKDTTVLSEFLVTLSSLIK